MKNTKTNNPNTPEKTPNKKGYRYTEEYMNMHLMRKIPTNIAFIELFAKQLVEWAINDEKAMKLVSFYSKNGISTHTIARWRKKYQVFAMANEFAKEIIGARRELGALYKKLDAGIVMRTMALYDKEWKELEEWRSELKKKIEETKKTGDVHVHMDSYLDKDEKSTKTSKGY